MRTELSALGPDEVEHAERVAGHVAAEIRAAGGWIPFSRFMALALYAPGLGYYAAGAHKLGRGGDFVTAPELSPVFARCLATQCAEVLGALGSDAELLEVGPGSGALAVELLGALSRLGCLPRRYRCLETSPDLRARQQARLAAALPGLEVTLEWLDAPPPPPFTGMILANEVLDALPVDRFRITAGNVESLGVSVLDGRLAWVARPAEAPLREALAAWEIDWPPSYTSEWCPTLAPWLAAIGAGLEAGAMLLIDYGAVRREYYHAARDGGTLTCFHRHREHRDPFLHLGLQDLTAWVDFTAVAEAGLAAGFEIGGFTTQAAFLLANDFEQHLAVLREGAGEAGEVAIVRAARRLVLPTDMGERFKCMALTRGDLPSLRGFSLRDFTATL
jgi:SAM-dependent MidA family methyltransferase